MAKLLIIKHLVCLGLWTHHMKHPFLQDFPILNRLTFLSRFVDFWRERVARGGCFAGVYFFGKNVSDLGGGILRLLVYFQYYLYLCRGVCGGEG